MSLVEVKVVTLPHYDESFELPFYATEGAAGADIRASIPEKKSITVKPGERLPSINEASEECYLSRDTVERAYTELHKMGVITSIFRKGYFISDAKVKTKTKVLFLVGKITNTNKVVFDSFCESLGKNVMVDIYTYLYKTSQFQEIMSQQLGNYHYYVIMPHLIEEEEENIKCLKKISGDRLILLDQNFNSISHAHASIVSQPKAQLIALFENQLNLFRL